MKKILLLILTLALTACGELGVDGEIVAPTRVPTSTTAPVVIVTATPEPTTPPTPHPAQMLAYVQAGALYLRLADFSGAPIQVDRCETNTACTLMHLRWSPDGTQLLYLRNTFDGASKNFLNVVDRSGAVRIVNDQINYVFAPTWSPDSQHFAYVVSTSDYVDNEQQLALHVVDANTLTDEMVGTLGFTVGCGGGPGSTSQQLLQLEGFGYFSTKLAWAAGDILLYSRMCDGAGIGRFDLKSRQRLEPYPDTRQLLNFTLNADRTRWVAVSMFDGGEKTEIALGNPAQVNYETFSTAEGQRLHSVFFGPQSGMVYYTTRQSTLSEYVDTLAYSLNSFPFISGVFDFYLTTLWAWTPSAEAVNLGTFDMFGIGSLTEDASGVVLFTQIPNDKLLYDAVKAGQSFDEVVAAQPYPSITRLNPGGGFETLIEHAGQVTLSTP